MNYTFLSDFCTKAQSFLSTAKFITKYSSERFLSICGEKIYMKAF